MSGWNKPGAQPRQTAKRKTSGRAVWAVIGLVVAVVGIVLWMRAPEGEGSVGEKTEKPVRKPVKVSLSEKMKDRSQWRHPHKPEFAKESDLARDRKDPKVKFAPDGKTRVRKLGPGKWEVTQADGSKFVTENVWAMRAALSVGSPELHPLPEKKPEDPNVPKKPPRYKSRYASQLAQFAVPGKMSAPLDFEITDEGARKACEQEVVFNFDDPDDVLNEKQAVKEFQADLLKYLDEGGHAKDYFRELEARQSAERETYQTVRNSVTEFLKTGDFEMAQSALDKYNEHLSSQGLPAIRMSGDFNAYRVRHGLAPVPVQL